MIYKVTAQGNLQEIHHALHDAFFGQFNIKHISQRKGKVIMEILSPVSITCIVEPIIGIELKFKEA